MAVNVEKRIADLENELKALKAICPISGALATMYVQQSETITVGGSSNLHAIEIDFTPIYVSSAPYLITLLPIVTSTYQGYTWEEIPYFIVQPQTGNGKIRVKIYSLTNTDKVSVIASGSSPGTFTRVS